MLYLVLIAILLFSVVIVCMSLPVWQITEITVEGVRIISPAKLIELANIPKGENLFFINLSRARNNLKEVTAIKGFNIFRRLPGTIVLKIKEREPFAVAMVEGQSVIIDDEGFVLSSSASQTSEALTSPLDPTGLPVMNGLKKSSLKNNRLDPETASVLSLFKTLPAGKLQLNLESRDDLNLMINDIIKVRLGDSKNIEEKMKVFKAMLSFIGDKRNQVEYIDLRFLNNPVVKFR